MRRQLVFAALILWGRSAVCAESAAQQMKWTDLDNGRIELRIAGKPVLVYNSGMELANGAPENRRRCCYVHPLYAPNGVVVTDDFPKDHWHHRGVFWSWPVVNYGGKKYDLWMHFETGLERRTISVKHDGSDLVAENGWFIGDKQIVREKLRIHPESAERIRFELEWEALAGPVELAGAPEENKGYGGFSIRFAPRTGTVIRSDRGDEPKDTDTVQHRWAELEGQYSNGRAAVRIDDRENDAWCVRHYGFLGVNFPGLKGYTLEPGKPVSKTYLTTLTAR
jgi:hypothetical protein